MDSGCDLGCINGGHLGARVHRSRRPYYPGPRWGQLDIVEAIFAQQAAPPALSLQSAATHRPVRILCHQTQIHRSQIQDPVSDDPGSDCPLLQDRQVDM